MTSGRLLIRLLLQRRSERPIRGFTRNFLYGFVSAVLFFLVLIIIGTSLNWNQFFGLLLITNGIFLFGWGAERLWLFVISSMLENPFSIHAYITRIPFWFIGGGIGFSLPLLFAYKLDLVYIFSVPQYKIFILGGFLEFFIQIPLQLILYRSLMRELNTFNNV